MFLWTVGDDGDDRALCLFLLLEIISGSEEWNSRD